MIPDSFIEELKYKTDIEQFIGSYVTLKRNGRNLSGLCPFHSEKTPSFVIYPDSQSFYCFGCGVGGGIIEFVRKTENLGYIEAVKFLAQHVGINVPDDIEKNETTKARQRILEINRISARFFHDTLMSENGRAGMNYLVSRGVTLKTIKQFGLGYTTDGWDKLKNHLLEKKVALSDMFQACVVTPGKSGNGYDIFRNRVMFPIIDIRGNVIGFGGRVLTNENPKYLNSADTLVFKKSRNLFSMNIAKTTKSSEIILAEGYMDVISMVQADLNNVVATLGTSLTGEQARLISQYAKEVIVAYDSDEAGQKATKRAIDIISPLGIKTRVLKLEGAKDPDEFIKKFGAKRFKLILDGSANSTEFMISSIKAKYDLTTEDGRVSYLKEFCISIAGLSNAFEAEIYIAKESREVGVSKEAVMERVLDIRKSKKYSDNKKQIKNLSAFSEDVPKFSKDNERTRNIRFALAEDKLIATLLRNPDYYSQTCGIISATDFVTQTNQKIFSVICKRLQEGLSIESILLSQYLDEIQMNHLSKLIATDDLVSFTQEDLKQYIDVILSYKNQRSPRDVAAMDTQQWLEYMTAISKGKK